MKKILFNPSLHQTVACPKTTAQLSYESGSLRICLRYSGAFGMGEKFDSFNQKGRKVTNRVEEKFCFQGDKTYCAAPFFWTDTGFGLYVNTYRVTGFDFQENCIVVALPEATELVVFSGTPKELIAQYMSLFGKALLPPEWAFGVWMSANRWSSKEEFLSQLQKSVEHSFPASVAVLEAWSDEATFYIFRGAQYTPSEGGAPLAYCDFDFSDSPWQDPKEMIDAVHSMGLKLLLWQIPVYKAIPDNEPANRQNELDCREAVKSGLCVRNSDGTPYRIPEGHWFSGSLIPDFTNPATVRSWFDKRQYLLDIGVDGFKTDGGEFIYRDDVAFYDGHTGKDGVNKYPQDYTNAYRDFIGQNRVLFSRAGYAGAHTVPMHWAGDQQSQNCELRSVLNAGLSAAASGILFWGFDIGGFAGPLPTVDLYRRATQLACFCPIMQWHSEPDGGQFRELMAGSCGNNERSPWNMAEVYQAPELLEELRYWHVLRQKLRPYLYLTAQKAVEASTPMLRPLSLDYPDDPIAVHCDDAFLLGDALLVAPLLQENQSTRSVYLPDGQWQDFFTGERYKGGQSVAAGGHGKLPVFLNACCSQESKEALAALCP